jgi:hypothetical protein
MSHPSPRSPGPDATANQNGWHTEGPSAAIFKLRTSDPRQQPACPRGTMRGATHQGGTVSAARCAASVCGPVTRRRGNGTEGQARRRGSTARPSRARCSRAAANSPRAAARGRAGPAGASISSKHRLGSPLGTYAAKSARLPMSREASWAGGGYGSLPRVMHRSCGGAGGEDSDEPRHAARSAAAPTRSTLSARGSPRRCLAGVAPLGRSAGRCNTRA